jgi:hypothetical protein
VLMVMIALCGPLAAGQTGRQRAGVQLQKVLALAPDEGVFAYARISPDGNFLAYASQANGAAGDLVTTQRVVDLRRRQIIFEEPGIDAYWSVDGSRMIFLSKGDQGGVTIRYHSSGRLVRDVAPRNLGDYYSWGNDGGRDIILTINNYYYPLDGERAAMPPSRVVACDDIGIGDRPLISKDARRLTTFVRGELIVRGLNHCANIFRTGIRAAKADFSFDGRYIAFHAPKNDGIGYEIQLVDVASKTVRHLTEMNGSSLFPSWTRDGRLCFRYDGPDYRGFMIASNVLDAPAGPLPSPKRPDVAVSWAELFGSPPEHALNLVMIWAPWSAHSPDALAALQEAHRRLILRGIRIGVFAAREPASFPSDAAEMRRRFGIVLPDISIAADGFMRTEAVNQIPTTLLFRGGVLVDSRLGAQPAGKLVEWVAGIVGI